MEKSLRADLVKRAIRKALDPRDRRNMALSSLAVAGTLASAVGLAQDSTQPGAAGLEEIVVTARKRDERAIDVPVAISAVNSAALDAAGIRNLTALFATLPGVSNNADGSRIANKPSIRGVGSTENASIRAKVTSFVDGVPLLGAQGIGSFAGLDRVEVLRGPQSAAFGRSTFGGAINYVTRSPGENLDLSLRATLGENDTRQISAVVGGPIIADKLGIMLTLQERNYGGDDGWKTTSGVQLGEENDKLAAVKLTFGVGESLRGDILYMYQKVDDSEPPILFASTAQLVPHPLNPSGTCAINGGPSSCVILGGIKNVPLVFDYDYDNATNPILDPGTRIRRDRVQGSLTWDLSGGYSLTGVASYTEEESDSWFDRDTFRVGAMQTIHAASTPEMNETYGELRLLSPDADRLSWLIGASIYDYDYTNTVYTNKTANIVMDYFAESAQNIGVFGSLTYDFTDRLTGSLEARYQSDEISSEYPANPARGAPEAIGDQSTTDSFQPRVALTYAISDANNVYVQVARGNNPAGFNTNTLDPVLQATAAAVGFDLDAFRTYDEEKLWSYELGLKGSAVANSLQYALAVYYLDWEGYVQPVTANWTPPGGVLLPGTTGNDYFSRLFINGGDLDGIGFEAEGSWRATDWLTLGGSLSYSTLEFTNDSCSPTPLDYGVPAVQTQPYRCALIGGALPPLFSDFTTSLYATVTHQLTESLEGYARVDHQYRSKRYTDVINTDYIPSMSNVDLRFGVRAEKWSAELYATNMLDDDTPSGAVRFFDGRLPGMVFNTTYQVRRPRELGISLAYDF